MVIASPSGSGGIVTQRGVASEKSLFPVVTTRKGSPHTDDETQFGDNDVSTSSGDEPDQQEQSTAKSPAKDDARAATNENVSAGSTTYIRPFPWCVLPDSFWFSWGVLILLFICGPCMALILTCEVVGWGFRWFYRRFSVISGSTDAILACVQRFFRKIGERVLLDPRNSPYLPWMCLHFVVCPTLFYWAYSRYCEFGFEPSTMLIYHFIRAGPKHRLFAYHQVLIHKEGHDKRGLFKVPFGGMNTLAGRLTREYFLDKLNCGFVGFFYGSVPSHYRCAHNKIHHRWHNDCDDVHTNLDLDRTKFLSFVIFLPRFFLYWTGISPLVLFIKRKEWKLAMDLGIGMVAFYSVGLLLSHNVSLTFCLCYWFYPHLEAITFLGMIAYLWHAFVEPDDPTNQYINSITIVRGKDNIWNEDFHVVHHHAPHVHWTGMPDHFHANKQNYADERATIFSDCEQGQLLHWLFSENWDALTDHWVDLNGGNHEKMLPMSEFTEDLADEPQVGGKNKRMTRQEVKEMIIRRLTHKKLIPVPEGVAKTSALEKWQLWGTDSNIRDWDNGKID